MTSKIPDLIKRQAAILAEVDRLDKAELNLVANLALASEPPSKARNLLRGLVRSQNVGRYGIGIQADVAPPVTVPALPGFFLIELMPLPHGGYHTELVLKTPVIAWKVDASNHSHPVIPGLPVCERWAVLMPNGLVARDEFTDLFGDYPMALKDWIRSEIDWLEDPLSAEYISERPAGTVVQ